MTEPPVIALAISVVLILGVSFAAQFGWLREGWVKTVVVFLAAAGSMVAIAAAGVPPSWFAGRATGFSLGLSFTLAAFIGSAAERTFRRPFFLGLGLVVLSVNAVQALRNVL